ncbi:hypothetical protein N9D31_02095 [Oligoflexaceae bacterium]|nr:hypothetical protein [Oligoflexaceae bacterium]
MKLVCLLLVSVASFQAEAASILLGPAPASNQCSLTLRKVFSVTGLAYRPAILNGLNLKLRLWKYNSNEQLQSEQANDYGIVKIVAGGTKFRIEIEQNTSPRPAKKYILNQSNIGTHFSNLKGVEWATVEYVSPSKNAELGKTVIEFDTVNIQKPTNENAVTDLVRRVVDQVIDPF